jgi:hypothetical protein
MAFEFPSPPTTHDVYFTDKAKWTYNGVGWQRGTLLKPTVTAIDPVEELHGNPAFTLTVTGTRFAADSAILYNAAAVPTTFVSETSLTAQITPPGLGGAVSGSVNVADATTSDFTITYKPKPVVTDIIPDGAAQGSAAFTLRVIGTGFVSTSQILYNGAGVATTFVSATELTCSVTPPAVGGATSATVNVAGATSVDFPLQYGVPPVVTSVTDVNNDLVAGSQVSLYVHGTGFVNGDIVNLDGVDQATTFRTTYLECRIVSPNYPDGYYPVFVKRGAIPSNTVNVHIF